MRHHSIACLALASAFSVFTAAEAAASCQWRVGGSIVRQDPLVLADGNLLEGPGSPVEVMLMARWSLNCPGGPCAWNTTNWLHDFTNARGEFDITSLPLPDPSCQTPRDFLVMYRDAALGVADWQTAHQIDGVTGPTQPSGPTLVPTFVHAVNLGPHKVEGFGPPPGIQLAEPDAAAPPPAGSAAPAPGPAQPLPPGTAQPAPGGGLPAGGPTLPPGTMQPAPGGIPAGPAEVPTLPAGTVGPAPDGGLPAGPAEEENSPGEDDPAAEEGHGPQLPDAVFEEDPCGLLRSGILPQPDFGYGPHPMSASTSVSPDGLVRIAQRHSGSTPMARRINATFIVTNHGGRDHRETGDACPVTLEVRFNEGPDMYANTPWHSWIDPVPTILQGASRLATVQGSLRGTGNDTNSTWNEGYEYVLIDVMLDVQNMVGENNESDNATGPYCYHAPSNSFVALDQCQSMADGE